MLQRLAEETPKKKSDMVGWFEDQSAAEVAFAFAVRCEAIEPISGNDQEDPFARWVISAKLVLRFAAEASARL
jgi:hypothetical protein